MSYDCMFSDFLVSYKGFCCHPVEKYMSFKTGKCLLFKEHQNSNHWKRDLIRSQRGFNSTTMKSFVLI